MFAAFPLLSLNIQNVSFEIAEKLSAPHLRKLEVLVLQFEVSPSPETLNAVGKAVSAMTELTHFCISMPALDAKQQGFLEPWSLKALRSLIIHGDVNLLPLISAPNMESVVLGVYAGRLPRLLQDSPCLRSISGTPTSDFFAAFGLGQWPQLTSLDSVTIHEESLAAFKARLSNVQPLQTLKCRFASEVTPDHLLMVLQCNLQLEHAEFVIAPLSKSPVPPTSAFGKEEPLLLPRLHTLHLEAASDRFFASLKLPALTELTLNAQGTFLTSPFNVLFSTANIFDACPCLRTLRIRHFRLFRLSFGKRSAGKLQLSTLEFRPWTTEFTDSKDSLGLFKFLASLPKLTSLTTGSKHLPLSSWDSLCELTGLQTLCVAGADSVHGAAEFEAMATRVINALPQLRKLHLPWHFKPAVERNLNAWLAERTARSEGFLRVVSLGIDVTPDECL